MYHELKERVSDQDPVCGIHTSREPRWRVSSHQEEGEDPEESPPQVCPAVTALSQPDPHLDPCWPC